MSPMNSGEPGDATKVIERFVSAFLQRDPTVFVDIVARDCVMETIQPAPNGTRYEGYEANVRFWQSMVADPHGSLEVEEVFVAGNRGVNRWRYRFGKGDDHSVRGVTLLKVENGKIVEALAYAKMQPVTDLGQSG